MTQLTLHQADGAHGAHGTCVGGAQASPLHANNLSGAASVCAATGDCCMTPVTTVTARAASADELTVRPDCRRGVIR